jgi:hypothetical protein
LSNKRFLEITNDMTANIPYLNKCNGHTGGISQIIWVSKYMIKKYGFEEAFTRVLKRKSNVATKISTGQ